jgi:hypothetical protein
MITFFKRLVGVGEEQVREQERFTKNLNGIAAKNKELDELQSQLEDIVVAVEDRTDQLCSIPSGTSGEHSLNLEGMAAHGRAAEEV